MLQAVIQVKIAAPKKEAKTKAAPATAGKGDAKPAAGSAQPKPVKRPASGTLIYLVIFLYLLIHKL